MKIISRRFSHTLLHHAPGRRHSSVLHGVGFGTAWATRRDNHLGQSRSAVEGEPSTLAFRWGKRISISIIQSSSNWAYCELVAVATWNQFYNFSQGIGYAVVLIAFYVDFFYNVIIAWSLRFFFASITDVLPWTSCTNSWNTNSCKPVDGSTIYLSI